ncbi:secreted protein [gut metagenome]|uniref:Secreted protein n=1 Tax=gut metagenome TaxID=749906 RepID=J9FQW7_9ZZZZ
MITVLFSLLMSCTLLLVPAVRKEALTQLILSSRRWLAASCRLSAQQQLPNIASILRRMLLLNVVFSRCW